MLYAVFLGVRIVCFFLGAILHYCLQPFEWVWDLLYIGRFVIIFSL